MADCLIIGFNDVDFASHEERVRRMGVGAGAYQDLNLSFLRYQGKPLRALDTLNHFRGPQAERLHNADFLWPVILILGSNLQRRGHSFDYVNLPHLERSLLDEKLADPGLLCVALTSTLYTEPQPLTELVSRIRARRPDVQIVIGGPYIAGQAKALKHADLVEQLHYLGADLYVISAEGQLALTQIVEALKHGAPLDAIENLAIRRGSSVVLTKRSVENNLLAVDRIDYSLFPASAYGEFVTTRTAKSCPFACAFCGFPERAGEYTYLSVPEVERELEAIASIGGITTLTIIDDTFNVPKARFKELLRMMIRRRFGFRWNSFFRCDHSDNETIDLMAESGCEGVILGIESGSDRILQLMNKSARRRHYLQAIPRLQSVGIDCYASLIVGFPGETDDTVQESIDLIETARPAYYRAQLWYCDPITPIYRQRDLHDLRGEGFQWTHRTMDVTEACRQINRMFLCVENSTWQPQAGFEFWSTFYLQRKGMSRAQVLRFLQMFNGSVKEKLLRPDGGLAEISDTRAQALERLSAFDAREDDLPEPHPLSGARYNSAETYWARCLTDLAQERRTDLVPSAHSTFTTVDIGEARDGDDALIASLIVASAGLQGGWRTLLLVQDGPHPELLPLYVAAEPSLQFQELIELVRRARSASEPHRALSLPILYQRLGFTRHKVHRPELIAAFLHGDHSWQRTRAAYPGLGDEPRILLQRGDDNRLRLQARFEAEVTRELAQVVGSLLRRDPTASGHIGEVSGVLRAIGEEATFELG